MSGRRGSAYPSSSMALGGLTTTAKAARSAASAMRGVVYVDGSGRFADATLETAFGSRQAVSEQRATAASTKACLGLLLLWGTYEAAWAVSGARGDGINQPAHYALFMATAAALSLFVAALAEARQGQLWRRLLSAQLTARLLNLCYFVFFTALCLEGLVQRGGSRPMPPSGRQLEPLLPPRQLPFFGLLLSGMAAAGALPARDACRAAAVCLVVILIVLFALSIDHYVDDTSGVAGNWPIGASPTAGSSSAARDLAGLTLGAPALLLAWTTALACWQCVAIEHQQRLVHALTAAIARQQARTRALLRASLPGALVDAMGRGEAPLLFHARATILVARVVGLDGILHLPRAPVLAARAAAAWATAVEAHGCTSVRSVSDDVLVALSGAPTAADAHAERGCLAALAAQKEVAKVGAELGVELGLSVGVHSGALVSGAVGGRRATYAAWGDAEWRADALKRLAPDGAVVASQAVLESIGRAHGRWPSGGDRTAAASTDGGGRRAPKLHLAFTEHALSSSSAATCYTVEDRM